MTSSESNQSEALSNLMHEERRFEPPAELAANANVKADAYEAADADFEGFWAEQAKRLSWAVEPTQTDPAEARRKISRAARRRVHARERRIRRTQRSLRAQLPPAW